MNAGFIWNRKGPSKVWVIRLRLLEGVGAINAEKVVVPEKRIGDILW
jgi:hypothetical protein